MHKSALPHSLNALYVACSLALPAALAPSLAGAQALEEVIVTARRREETLQDIPVTVTAIGEQQIQQGMVMDLRDVGRLVPNMQVYSAGSGSGSGIYLRGIGSSTISAAFDPAVALNLDGVPLAASRMIVAGQMDTRQIEVLKGPQSLYFGAAIFGIFCWRSTTGPSIMPWCPDPSGTSSALAWRCRAMTRTSIVKTSFPETRSRYLRTTSSALPMTIGDARAMITA